MTQISSIFWLIHNVIKIEKKSNQKFGYYTLIFDSYTKLRMNAAIKNDLVYSLAGVERACSDS